MPPDFFSQFNESNQATNAMSPNPSTTESSTNANISNSDPVSAMHCIEPAIFYGPILGILFVILLCTVFRIWAKRRLAYQDTIELIPLENPAFESDV